MQQDLTRRVPIADIVLHFNSPQESDEFQQKCLLHWLWYSNEANGSVASVFLLCYNVDMYFGTISAALTAAGNSAATITLLQDGLEKVLKGYTTFEEIYKLIEIEDGLDIELKDIVINEQ